MGSAPGHTGHMSHQEQTRHGVRSWTHRAHVTPETDPPWGPLLDTQGTCHTRNRPAMGSAPGHTGHMSHQEQTRHGVSSWTHRAAHIKTGGCMSHQEH
ncbi:hypothetical protein ACOMHN_067023 [Nucella lapillus]